MEYTSIFFLSFFLKKRFYIYIPYKKYTFPGYLIKEPRNKPRNCIFLFWLRARQGYIFREGGREGGREGEGGGGREVGREKEGGRGREGGIFTEILVVKSH